MKNSILKNNKLIGMTAGILLLSTSFGSHAALVTVTGGTFSADFSQGITGFWGDDPVVNALPNGTALVNHPGGFTSGPNETAVFKINNGDPITNPTPGSRGRIATDFSYDDGSTTLSDLATSGTGTIGLTGVLKMPTNTVTGDYTISATDLDAVAGAWLTRNNIDFPGFASLDMVITGSTIDANGFTLSGDMFANTNLAPFMGVSANDNVGTFTLEATTVVPVPAAVWLFGSGLLGLVATRRKQITI